MIIKKHDWIWTEFIIFDQRTRPSKLDFYESLVFWPWDTKEFVIEWVLKFMLKKSLLQELSHKISSIKTTQLKERKQKYWQKKKGSKDTEAGSSNTNKTASFKMWEKIYLNVGWTCTETNEQLVTKETNSFQERYGNRKYMTEILKG